MSYSFRDFQDKKEIHLALQLADNSFEKLLLLLKQQGIAGLDLRQLEDLYHSLHLYPLTADGIANVLIRKFLEFRINSGREKYFSDLKAVLQLMIDTEIIYWKVYDLGESSSWKIATDQFKTLLKVYLENYFISRFTWRSDQMISLNNTIRTFATL